MFWTKKSLPTSTDKFIVLLWFVVIIFSYFWVVLKLQIKLNNIMKTNFKKDFTIIIGIIILVLSSFSANAQTKTYKKVTKKISNKESKQKKELV